MDRQSVFIIITTAIVVLSGITAGFLVLQQKQKEEEEEEIPQSLTGTFVPPPAYIKGRNFTFPYYENLELNPLTGDYRPRYKNLTDEEYKNLFKDLPKFPKNFYVFLKAYYEGKISDITRLSENYWKQPEFYGFDQIYVDRYYVPEKRNPNLWTPRGFGVFPGIACRQVKAGDTVTINFFIHTSPGVEACQVLELIPILPPRAYNIIGEVMFEQPSNAEKYFDLAILNKDEIYKERIEPKLEDIYKIPESHGIILLPPTLYWVDGKQYGFPPSYLQMIDLQIKVHPDTPKGRYVIGLNITEPNRKIQEEYYWIFLDEGQPDYEELQNTKFYHAKDLVFGSGEYTTKYYWFELILDVV
ncbi:hypothetical protein DRN52_03380 [Thermococci archaeon]|nr:MAG: hypothetical protein DRN52_03380 [Thermococci archaeon]